MTEVNEVGAPEPEASPSEQEIIEGTPEDNKDDLSNIGEIEETPTEEVVEETPEETPKEDEEPKEEEPVEEEPKEELSLRDQELVKRFSKEFPDALKKFPEIRSALYRDKEFSKVFINPADAKEAAESMEVLDYFQDAIVDGNAEVLIESISKDMDDKVLEKFALNFVPALHKKNPEVYNKVVEPLAKNLLASAFKAGKAGGPAGKNLALAAQHLNLWLFENKEPSGAKLGFEEKVDPEVQQVRTEREQNFKASIVDSGKKEMRAKIEARLDKSIKGGIREVIVEKTLLGIGKVLNKDESYGRQRDSLFRKAARSNFAGDWGTRILSLYTGQATKLLPAVLGVVQKEFLPAGGNNANPNPKSGKVNVQGGRQTPKAPVSANQMKPGEKDVDFLAR